MSQRIQTGIAGLDEMLTGGFMPKSANLVWGAPGCGKTTLGLEFLYRGALQGSRGLWISFEEFPRLLYRDAAGLGWDLESLEQENKLQLAFTSPKVFLRNLEADDNLLDRFQPERVVVDSISHFRRITQNPHELRQVFRQVVNRLKRAGTTSLLIGESSQADFCRVDEGQISFLVDSIITLNYVEIDSEIRRALAVLKMRGSDHAREIRRFEIQTGGITVLEQFHSRDGILSGISRRTG
jgi:circadian clock protein KaiC